MYARRADSVFSSCSAFHRRRRNDRTVSDGCADMMDVVVAIVVTVTVNIADATVTVTVIIADVTVTVVVVVVIL